MRCLRGRGIAEAVAGPPGQVAGADRAGVAGDGGLCSKRKRRSEAGGCGGERFVRDLVVQPEACFHDRGVCGQRRRGGCERGLRGCLQRVAIDACGDRGQRHHVAVVLCGQGDRLGVAAGEQLALAVCASAPHRSDRVDDMACRQAARCGDLRMAGLATAELAAFAQQLRSRRPVDGAVDTAAAEQSRVRRVDDRFGLAVLRDVPEVQRDASRHGRERLVRGACPNRPRLGRPPAPREVDEDPAHSAESLIVQADPCNAQRWPERYRCAVSSPDRRNDSPNGAALFEACNKLRGSVESAEYKHLVLGLIFLKYISDSFEHRRRELEAELADPSSPAYAADEQERAVELDDRDAYVEKDVFWVPESARWPALLEAASRVDVAKRIDDALETIERENPPLRGVLSRIYVRSPLSAELMGQLVETIAKIGFGKDPREARDVLGRTYEYFIKEFARAEGHRGGEFFTPAPVARLLVEMLEPYRGRVLDPACGSCGLFVQSAKFVEAHGGRPKEISQRHAPLRTQVEAAVH